MRLSGDDSAGVSSPLKRAKQLASRAAAQLSQPSPSELVGVFQKSFIYKIRWWWDLAPAVVCLPHDRGRLVFPAQGRLARAQEEAEGGLGCQTCSQPPLEPRLYGLIIKRKVA